ncbi:isochorismate lyase [Candidatus Gracilibacteria bacterium]|jgi:isochorismate pyruvate lyase|nr:isochorismate lyase [Candidatus Gracilibacteria bacterium]NJM88472.1 isochorismate lyase [Hydrococcus sp. RU_2_2]NJP19903.1 isochorismate lyase [Hydrococcus sp. CRU_1_1]NJQ96782.1 isochorismate lyase [Hydrococcus sp. CSU_1_8]
MKLPDECNNIQEIRTEIDYLDRELIKTIGTRFAYVKAATKFKTDETSVKAPERFKAMLEQRRVWAVEEGLNPEIIEQLYRDLVNYFIDEELKDWQRDR